MRRAILVLAVVSLSLGGCNWLKSLGKKDNVEPPTELVEFTPSVSVQKLWSGSIGKGAGKSGARMNPAVVGDRLYVASVSGELQALDAASGRRLWSTNVKKMSWSGGPAATADIVVVGALNGQVHAFSAADGSERWSVQLSSEIISAPAISDEVIAVRAQDGRLYGLDPANGSRRWVYEQAVPVLSLRGNSPPLIGDGFVFDGYDSGRLVSVRETDGAAAWTQVLSAGEGRTEVERLADSDGQLVLDNGELFASSYNGQIASFHAESGRPFWARDVSSFAGLAVSATTVVISGADGTVWAFDRQSGANLWKQDGLLHRWLSAPAVVGDYAVVGDLDGYVHWLKLSDGSFAARQRVGKKAIESAPVVSGDVVYVESANGNLAAFRTQ
ncbi:MAG TPA: outer membrane protein assembly factor BamB [Dokdonella sp.]|uniref:outer membrane protein assembly factor BamB n=1 Tax=Dokdonella sp. TaxID=2291710 RepID=UPI002D7F4539|nr:outer membrane protein assembly factor BamB [Dokdonella sp.]HET9031618.1 outer membrane protein assembly factor BamB [Dokdonella sp.]